MIQGSFQQKLAHGRRYEVAFAEWLKRERGYFILPTYDYSGAGENKAPRLQGLIGGWIIPDVMGFREGAEHPIRWFEIKYKSRSDFYRKTQTNVTGISRRVYEHYKRVKFISATPVYLIFIHEQERRVVGGEIDAIETHHHHYDTGDKMCHGGMKFYKFDALPYLTSFGDLTRFLTPERAQS